MTPKIPDKLSDRETFDGVVQARVSVDYYNLSAWILYDAALKRRTPDKLQILP